MKNKALQFKLVHGNRLTSLLTLIAAFLVLGASAFAQIQPDKLRTVPTVEGDASTEFNFGEHVTDTMASYGGRMLVLNKNGTNQIDECRTGAWAEYQIISPLGGKFLVQANCGSKMNDVLLNIGVYKTLTESWPEGGAGDTVAVTNSGNWNSEIPHYFTIDLEAGEVYTLRITFLAVNDADQWTVNLHNGLIITELTGSTDATLKDLKMNGQTIEGFDPDVLDYTIALPPYQWIEGLEAVLNDDKATMVVPEDFTPVEGESAATYTIAVTSESGVGKEYKVTVVTPKLIEEGTTLSMAGDVFYNQGIAVSATKVNSMNNGDYMEYYIFSEFDDNFKLTLNCTNGYDNDNNWLNVSTLSMDDSTWVLNEIYTKHIPTTRDESGIGQWSDAYAQDIEYVFSLKAEEPIRLRIYAITGNSNAADIFSMTFNVLFESIDATLSDLQIDGTTLADFDPNKTTYNVPVAAGSVSSTITATATDSKALGIEGLGQVDIEGFKTADTITVTSESGFAIDYLVNLFTPLKIDVSPTDSMYLLLADYMYYNGGVRVTNTLVNYINNEDYCDYYIYSETTKDIHAVFKVANGNPAVDTIYAKLNVSTFATDEEWVYDEANSIYIPNTGSWHDSTAIEVKYNFSLEAGKPVFMRVYGMTNKDGAGDISRVTFVEGSTDYVGVDDVAQNSISVWGGEGSINLKVEDAYLGGSVQVFDIAGKLVINEMLKSTNTNYTMSKGGVYIVKVVGPNNSSNTVKCMVR